MGESGTAPGYLRAAAIDWRARQIDDPVERLRYLRRSTQAAPRRLWFRSRAARWSLGVVPGLLLLGLVMAPSRTPSKARMIPRVVETSRPQTQPAVPEVWPVEQTARFDLYSNGLRIENEFAVSNQPRRPFPVYPSGAVAAADPVEWQAEPAGIVFHSTESHQAPFEAAEVHSLKRIGRNLLAYVRAQRSYHFVIDRFGRVFRIVNEGDVAYHAGKSIWADARGSYVNLNSSFLSVALEAQTDASSPLSAAQIHATRILTEMLRARFRISETNCVTHAQVSVNPSNMRIGYHTDWASGFPFAQVGLPDNYAQGLPSLTLFGFEYDTAFINAAGGRPWTGILASDQLFTESAGAVKLAPNEYRKRLQQRYRNIINAQLRMNEVNQDES